MILPRREQHRRPEPADQRETRKQFRILGKCQCNCGRGYQRHRHERRRSGNQVVHLKCAPQRQIERANPDCLQRIGERVVSLGSEALAPHHQANSRQQPDCYAPAGPIQLFSNAYFRKYETPTRMATIPMRFSQYCPIFFSRFASCACKDASIAG